MKRLSNYAPVFRAVAVLSAVGILVTSVTYAALQSQNATLTGNSIRSATADLRIGTTASTFSATRAGFTFADVLPGGPAMPADGHDFYLKNYGSTTLALKLAVNSTVANTSNIDLEKVSVQLTRVDSGTAQTFTLKALVDAQAAGGLALTDNLAPNPTVAQYKLRTLMAADAFSGTGVNVEIEGIDLVFSGVPAV
jgi:hypothetical protein